MFDSRMPWLVVLTTLVCQSALADGPPSEGEMHSSCEIEPLLAGEGRRYFQFAPFSPDGRFMAVGWDEPGQIRGSQLLDRETGTLVDIPTLNNGGSYSPDGAFLVGANYMPDGKTDILELELATGATSTLAEHEAWDWLATYSPNGSKVLFNSFRDGNSDVYLLDRDSGQIEQLSNAPGYEAHAQMSPDGSSVIYNEMKSPGNFDLALLDMDTRERVYLTDGEGEESYASWSPDGRYIVYVSDAGIGEGIGDIYVMRNNGDTVARLTNDRHKDGYPFWSPDGKVIVFNSDRKPEGIYQIALGSSPGCWSPETE